MSFAAKRKWSEVDADSDDEEPTLGKQVLPVANLPNNFNGEPVDGLQYLFTVRRDSRRLPNVTRVPNPYELKEEPREASMKEPTLSTNHYTLPSEEWRDTFLKRFKNFRKNTMQKTIHVDFHGQKTSQKVTPDKKERDAWWAFISGRPESDWNPPKKPKVESSKSQKQRRYGRGMRGFSDDQHFAQNELDGHPWQINEEGEVELAVTVDPSESLPTPSSTPAPDRIPDDSLLASTSDLGSANFQVSETFKYREPTPFILRHIDHRYSLHLLMYFTHWINLHLEQPHPQASHITETHALWIFSLLSRVDDYVSADEMSLLRNLARACIALLKERLNRATISDKKGDAVEVGAEKEDMRIHERSCWMIITAVIGNWGQRDLWMDAESMLAEIKD